MFRVFWTSWINGPGAIVWCSITRRARSCPWITIAPCSITGLGERSRRAAWQKKDWMPWLKASQTWSSIGPRWPRRPKTSWPVSKIIWPAGPGKLLSGCTQHWWDHTSNPVLNPGFDQDKDKFCSSQKRALLIPRGYSILPQCLSGVGERVPSGQVSVAGYHCFTL